MGGFGSLFWLYVFFFFSCRETLPAKLEVLSHPISLSRSGNWPSAMSRAVVQSERGSPIQPFLSHPSSRRMAEPATDPVIDTPVPTSEATGSEEVKFKVMYYRSQFI